MVYLSRSGMPSRTNRVQAGKPAQVCRLFYGQLRPTVTVLVTGALVPQLLV